MPDTIQVGGLALDGRLIAYLIAIVAGYYMIRLRLHMAQFASSRLFLDVIINSVMIVVLIWKFGIVFYNPSLLWTKPVLILMSRGTWELAVAGLVIALIYAGLKLRKVQVKLLLFLDVIPFGVGAALICVNVLIKAYGIQTTMPWGITQNDPSVSYHPLHIYQLLLSCAVLTRLWWKRDVLGQGKVLQDSLMMYGLGLWFISYFSYGGFGKLLTGEHIVYLSMIVCGLIIPYIIRGAEYR